MTHSTSGRDGRKLRRVGSFWKPREGARSLGSGSLTIGRQRQRFIMLRNERKQKESDPDFVLMASDEPEPDPYAQCEPVARETGVLTRGRV
jgi:hypothetical protein